MRVGRSMRGAGVPALRHRRRRGRRRPPLRPPHPLSGTGRRAAQQMPLMRPRRVARQMRLRRPTRGADAPALRHRRIHGRPRPPPRTPRPLSGARRSPVRRRAGSAPPPPRAPAVVARPTGTEQPTTGAHRRPAGRRLQPTRHRPRPSVRCATPTPAWPGFPARSKDVARRSPVRRWGGAAPCPPRAPAVVARIVGTERPAAGGRRGPARRRLRSARHWTPQPSTRCAATTPA
jgi:hypothetical protein